MAMQIRVTGSEEVQAKLNGKWQPLFRVEDAWMEEVYVGRSKLLAAIDKIMEGGRVEVTNARLHDVASLRKRGAVGVKRYVLLEYTPNDEVNKYHGTFDTKREAAAFAKSKKLEVDEVYLFDTEECDEFGFDGKSWS